MIPSPAGLLVAAALLLLGYALRAPVIVGLFASLPFGSTAIGTLIALGGSTPLIYTAFVLLLLAGVAFSRGFLNDLARVFANYGTAWIVVALIAYAILSAIVFPRLFAGQTVALVAAPGGAVRPLPLAPVSGNITQTGYFVLGAFAFFAFAVLLVRGGYFEAVRRGFLTWAVIHAALGIADLLGKAAGARDLMSPIRTASYAYLVDVEEAGFWRIAGGHAEASAFGSVTLACLAFSYTYWRASRSQPMLLLTIVLFCLLILSTSSAAYAGFAIVAPFAGLSILLSALRGRLTRRDILLFALGWLALTAALFLYLYSERLFDPFVRLFESMILNKAMSSSAQERLYWNTVSMQAFLDTGGVGIGLGSSRASSWVVAVISQLGAVGLLLMSCLVGLLLWDLVSSKRASEDPYTRALVSGARSSVLASLASASVASGSADPGLPFFIALALVVVYRKPVARRAPVARSLQVAGSR